MEVAPLLGKQFMGGKGEGHFYYAHVVMQKRAPLQARRSEEAGLASAAVVDVRCRTWPPM
ncbi:hypothetical protein [Ralstonia sp. UBA689]|uniref:hypothetical protein n=1 Tax=Ralstonia sp. UBA689 TaxID=1947373 RepID=UPI0025EA2E56|nr:hypothetical protein [Ralstonia sp. UBA689]